MTFEQAEQFHFGEMPSGPSALEEMETMERMINSAKLVDRVREELTGDIPPASR
jgi:hypothetical protein